MAYQLFNRSVQVQISKRSGGSTAPELLQRNPTKTETVDTLIIPKNPLTEKLKIDFSLSTKGNSSTDASYIEIYNLNDKTQSFIKDLNNEVKFLAGYGDNMSIIFDGNVTKVDITRKSNDIITKITLGNSVDYITNAYFSKSYAGLINIQTIIADALKTIPLQNQFTNLIPPIQIFNFAWDGKTQDLLNYLLKPLKLHWYVDRNVIKFSVIDKANSPSKFVATPDTGLIDYPTKTDNGVNLNVLLNPKINISDLVEIKLDSRGKSLDGRSTNLYVDELNGTYKILNIVHKGSSYDGDMITSLECGIIK